MIPSTQYLSNLPGISAVVARSTTSALVQGIVVTLYWRDHLPPAYRVTYGDHENVSSSGLGGRGSNVARGAAARKRLLLVYEG